MLEYAQKSPRLIVMTRAPVASLSLTEFLALPSLKASPAWEYHHGQAQQKPTPNAHHSRLQLKLATAINDVAEAMGIAVAFPELRCTFGDRSLVPDIAVLQWSKIPVTETGELQAGAIPHAPDWTIEILSPGQSSTQVIDSILFCLAHGTQLGWLIDPEDRGILVFHPPQVLHLYRGGDRLPGLAGIELALTADQVFQWLTLQRPDR
jgi:Uma2 family endonuclease